METCQLQLKYISLHSSRSFTNTSLYLSTESPVSLVVDGVDGPPSGQAVDHDLPGVWHQNMSEHWTQVKSLICIEQELKYRAREAGSERQGQKSPDLF